MTKEFQIKNADLAKSIADNRSKLTEWRSMRIAIEQAIVNNYAIKNHQQHKSIFINVDLLKSANSDLDRLDKIGYKRAK